MKIDLCFIVEITLWKIVYSIRMYTYVKYSSSMQVKIDSVFSPLSHSLSIAMSSSNSLYFLWASNSTWHINIKYKRCGIYLLFLLEGIVEKVCRMGERFSIMLFGKFAVLIKHGSTWMPKRIWTFNISCPQNVTTCWLVISLALQNLQPILRVSKWTSECVRVQCWKRESETENETVRVGEKSEREKDK